MNRFSISVSLLFVVLLFVYALPLCSQGESSDSQDAAEKNVQDRFLDDRFVKEVTKEAVKTAKESFGPKSEQDSNVDEELLNTHGLLDTISEHELEEIHLHYSAFSMIDSPGRMFQFVRRTYLNRHYYACALVFPEKRTKYTMTEEQRRTLLGRWNYIIDRLREVDSNPFPKDGTTSVVRKFRSSAEEIELKFVKEADGCWHFGTTTVEKTNEIYRRVLGLPPIRHEIMVKIVPAWMFHIVGGLSYLQWTLIIGGLFVAFIIYSVLKTVFVFLVQCWMKLFFRREASVELRNFLQPIAAILAAIFWYQMLHFVVLSPRMNDLAYYFLSIFVTTMGVILVLRLIDVFIERFRRKVPPNDLHLNSIVVPLAARGAKIIAICLGIFALAYAFQWPLITVLSGMGIGGVAIAFAAKETLGDFFGSMTVLVDRPFTVGDWIITGHIEGTVESIGIRSTKIRTFYHSLVTIPNNKLTTAVVDNLGRRKYRRFRTPLSITLNTPTDRIEEFCDGIRQLILLDPNTRKDVFTVELHEIRHATLEILMIVFFVCPDAAAEMKARSQLLRDVLRLAQELHIVFAFPTQTVHIDSERQETSTQPQTSAPVSPAVEGIGRETAEAIFQQRKPEARVPLEPTKVGLYGESQEMMRNDLNDRGLNSSYDAGLSAFIEHS